jgi:hypothetical protein
MLAQAVPGCKDEKMNDTDTGAPKFPDPTQWAQHMAEIARLSEKLVRDFLAQQPQPPSAWPIRSTSAAPSLR